MILELQVASISRQISTHSDELEEDREIQESSRCFVEKQDFNVTCALDSS